jgi:hypothetical protein
MRAIALFMTLACACMIAPAQEPRISGQLPEVPQWAREQLPAPIQPFLGRAGLPEPWRSIGGPLGSAVAGIDHWQANHFVVYRPETAKFLYEQYTPVKVSYRPGSLPLCEQVAARHTAGLSADREKALALLRAMPLICRHPTMPPLGGRVRPDRGLLDEALLESGVGFCNEQARIFVRLCQVSGIPARMVFLFHADQRTGHVVAEFYADGRWAMADASWMCAFPDEEGRLMSAAELHEKPAGPQRGVQVLRARFEELLKLADAELDGPQTGRGRRIIEDKLQRPDVFDTFGVLNYPSP